MKQLDDRSIETNGEIIKFDIAIRQIVEYKDFFVILLREKREVPNNIIAYDYYGKEIWKINDIVQAKIPRGYAVGTYAGKKEIAEAGRVKGKVAVK